MSRRSETFNRVEGVPPVTGEQQARLNALAARSDEGIDYSDIPPLTDEFWKRAVRNPFYRPVKRQLTVRIDADVVAWLRSGGKGYQTRLNRILRRVMEGDGVKE
ncbi:MAG TPA: BrnA antitoxin family protein [Caulobacteraceae bacterium]|nr:BrnA antitoxin family protein [Caulobacteraceae bacterium]